jgi:hypothetical protein
VLALCRSGVLMFSNKLASLLREEVYSLTELEKAARDFVLRDQILDTAKHERKRRT